MDPEVVEKQPVLCFVLVRVLLGFSLATSTSFCSSVGKHPVFENRGIVSFRTFSFKVSGFLAKFLFIDRSGICCGPRELFFSASTSLVFMNQI